jgi:hypothetical protein
MNKIMALVTFLATFILKMHHPYKHIFLYVFLKHVCVAHAFMLMRRNEGHFGYFIFFSILNNQATSCSHENLFISYLFFTIFQKYISHFKFCKSLQLPPYGMPFGSNRHMVQRLEVL